MRVEVSRWVTVRCFSRETSIGGFTTVDVSRGDQPTRSYDDPSPASRLRLAHIANKAAPVGGVVFEAWVGGAVGWDLWVPRRVTIS